ncbi:MAG TPA: L,D-transpeptidase [Kofleriaceae bacterium]|nr:L,D-transpeptidase [Kofleriaceae bacterium]
MRSAVLALICLAACKGDPAPAPEAPASGATRSRPEPALPSEPSPFPPGTLSLELRRTVGVRFEPFESAKRIGTIAIDTRVGFGRAVRGEGCASVWVELVPRGWVCAEHLEPRREPPKGDELPRLDRGEIVPGVYGKVVDQGATTMVLEAPKPAPKGKKAAKSKAAKRGAPVTSPSQLGDADEPDGKRGDGPKLVPGRPMVGSVKVRQYKELVVDDKVYWKISPTENEYLLASAIHRHKPSEFRGSRLGDDTGLLAPVAFVWPRGGGLTAWTRETAKTGAKRQVPRRMVVSLLETAADAAGRPYAYRIGAAEWIDASSLRLFVAAAPPPLLLPNERWIDVDLDTQILVAYEGELPVYATLVSGGAKQTPTETGVYRIWKKMAENDMNGLSGEDPYSVATVPWTQFYSPEKGLALHTSYWHDDFGITKSHGCVNLAPTDARWLYFWSDPFVPPGWTMTAGILEAPGSLVRVRSKADPTPELRGYAKRVQELRATGAPPAEDL